jgi:hypothetical protein
MDECIQGIISWADQFWVTSLPAPVSDNASRNLWIQTHSQFHVPSTPVNLPPCVRKSFCAEGAEILLIRDSTPTQSGSSPGRIPTGPFVTIDVAKTARGEETASGGMRKASC